MSDMEHHFEALKDISKQRKQPNLERSTSLLKANSIHFESKNEGVHLIVTGKNGLIDFWPSTGKFKQRCDTNYKRGVFNLLKLCEVAA